MQTPPVKTPALARQNCLGCSDCKGLCRDIVELAFLPETVLQKSIASP